ncbi:MAG: hypothetical protein R3F53_28645 [Gammaproteobacteria bacterium]
MPSLISTNFCQLLADMLTFQEQRGSIKGKTVAWIGDGNNMCNSLCMEAALQLDFQLRIACPEGFEPDQACCNAVPTGLSWAVTCMRRRTRPIWSRPIPGPASRKRKNRRARRPSPIFINADVMARARPKALFLHCLPAYREQEVSTDVIDGPQSQVWEQAENRLHAQKALIEYLLTRSPRKISR